MILGCNYNCHVPASLPLLFIVQGRPTLVSLETINTDFELKDVSILAFPFLDQNQYSGQMATGQFVGNKSS